MNIKRFTAPDMRRGIRQIREELGSEAVILSSHKVDAGVEIVAAIDYEEPAKALLSAPPSFVLKTQQRATDRADSEPNADISREMRAMRHLLESRLSRLTWNESARCSPLQAQAMRNLASLGLTPGLVDDIVRAIGPMSSYEQAWRQPLEVLIDRLPALDSEPIDNGGVFALVGPTGVGKTTAIAKLAARYTLRRGPGRVALVAADDYRIGARAQLSAYGEILGAPVHVAGDGAELKRTLDSLRRMDLVLIDTTGLGHRDVRMSEQLAAVSGAATEVEYLLTLAANAQPESLQASVEAFAALRPAACVLTKIDEAVVLGGALSTIITSALPLAYLCNGQRVPEDILEAAPRREWLLKAAAERIQHRGHGVDEEYMAKVFGEVSVHDHA